MHCNSVHLHKTTIWTKRLKKVYCQRVKKLVKIMQHYDILQMLWFLHTTQSSMNVVMSQAIKKHLSQKAKEWIYLLRKLTFPYFRFDCLAIAGWVFSFLDRVCRAQQWLRQTLQHWWKASNQSEGRTKSLWLSSLSNKVRHLLLLYVKQLFFAIWVWLPDFNTKNISSQL